MEVKKRDKKKNDESKSEVKDSITGNTVWAYIENTTTTKESAPPNRTPIIGAHVLETNIQSSNSLRTVEELLDTHSVDNDDFIGNINPTDVSIGTVNSEEMMVGSHITEFHTYKQEEPVTTELSNNASNVPGQTCIHDADGGHLNQSDSRSAKPTDYRLHTYEDDSFFQI